MKGGSLKPQELRDFLQASYEKNAPIIIFMDVFKMNHYLIYMVKMVNFMSIRI